MNGKYAVITNEATHLVANTATGAVVGGWGCNYFRPWVYPLYSPNGRSVVQAFPHAHPWHNGIFVGQQPVMFAGQPVNFWGTPPTRYPEDPLSQHQGRVKLVGVKSSALVDGLMVRLDCLWLDSHDTPVLRELRSIAFRELEGGMACDLTSAKTAAFGELHFPQTKLGGLGLRLDPRLTPEMGGVILAEGGRRGKASVVHEGESAFVAYESGLPATQGGALGVCMLIMDDSVRGPWFIRDYGMALYNPTWAGPISVPMDGTWEISFRVIAYDGELKEENVARWRVPAL